jgi:hypothetical protein
MRIEGQSKLGYYPTPDSQLPLIASWLSCQGNTNQLTRLLDPCAGKGEALAFLAHALDSATGKAPLCYGIELSYSRAEEAASRLNHVLAAGFENAVLTDGTFSFCLLNPPYDGETATGGGQRLESSFLLQTTPLLCEGGILAYIIPETRIDEKVARHLASWYGDLRCLRFTETEYRVFRQVVIFGRKKPYRQPTQEVVDEIRHGAQGQVVIGYEDRIVPLTDDEILLARLEKAVGKLPEGVQVANRVVSLTSGQMLTKQNASEATLVWAMKAQAWLEKQPAELLDDDWREADRPTKKVHVPILADLPTLTAGNGEYVIPPSPVAGPKGQAFRFQQTPISEEDYLRAADKAAQSLEKSRAWETLRPETEAQTITPAITPKLGHVSMLVTAGLLGTTLVTHDGQALLIKGGTEKYTVKVEDDGNEEEIEQFDPDNPEQKKSLFRVRVEERSRPTLYTLTQDGDFTFSNDANWISDRLRTHVNELAQRVLARNVPRYDMKPEAWEWQALAPLSLGRALPGRQETGLTPMQKHLSIAMGRLLHATGSGLASYEMGAGKSSVALAVAEYLSARLARNGSTKTAYPMLVVGPGIVTGDQNWPKEVREVVPGAMARVIETAARPLPKPAKLKEWLPTIGVHLVNEDAYKGKSARWLFGNFVQDAAQHGRSLTKQERAALWQTLCDGERHPPAKRRGAEQVNLLDARIGGLAWLGMELPCDKEHAAEMSRRYSLAQFFTDYQSGLLPKKSVAILSYETAKLGSGRVPAMRTRKLKRTWQENGEPKSEIIEACSCPTCGGFVAEAYDEEGGAVAWEIVTPAKAAQFIGAKRRYCQNRVMKWAWNAESGQHEMVNTDKDGNPLVCGAPLFEYSDLRREAAARYIQRKAKKFFPYLAVDELHESAAKGTGNGWALTVLANCTRYTIGLTGTLFGGKSTSIYWLMFRLSSLVRRDFGFHDENAWAKRYGLLRYTFYVTRPEDVLEDGSYTGAKFLNSVDERPGILPTIIKMGLPKITFASLQDIGLPLPLYNEEVVWLRMSDEMALQYDHQADGSGGKDRPSGKPYPPGSLYKWAIEEIKEGTRGAISVWLNAALNRVNSMFRDENVLFNRRISGRGKYALRRMELVKKLPAIDPNLISPKDRWLAARCQAERDEGRKSIVFIRQTGKRDIQPHIARILQDNGLRVGVLSPSVEPRRRMAWLERHTPHLDVLLTNARLVRVGLNLRMFSTEVFYEIEWSLAILWQAMRRVYRPGSPLPVRVLFPTYENTLEERAINLLGQKMKAAQLFYGDEISSSLCDEEDGDFLNDLVLSVLKGEQIQRATSIFASQNDMTASPLGSPTALSPQIGPVPARTWVEWMAARNLAAPNKGKSRKLVQQNGQISLWG